MKNDLNKLVRVFDVMKTVTEQVPERAYDVREKARLDRQLRAIMSIPAVDAVEVVRCRECKHRYYYEDGNAPVCTASMAYVNTPDDWFCKDGQFVGRVSHSAEGKKESMGISARRKRAQDYPLDAAPGAAEGGNMKQEELNKIIENHLHWIREDIDGWQNMRADLSGADLYGADLSGADLSGADLSGANLYGADLSGADLYGADLSGADLSGADLSGANLSRANLYGADLSGADLYGADLSGADLYGADLSGADLYGADLSGADLYGADLSGAYHLDTAKGLYLPTVCPSDGEFTAWKKCRDGAVVKLLIPDTALRSSASGRKCRASEAVVLTIYDKDGNEVNEARSGHDSDFIYRVGETVKPVQKFDTNRWNECAPGIHFFVTREEAERYGL